MHADAGDFFFLLEWMCVCDPLFRFFLAHVVQVQNCGVFVLGIGAVGYEWNNQRMLVRGTGVRANFAHPKGGLLIPPSPVVTH